MSRRKTFYMWLRQQRWRDDEIGDLARDIWDDRRNIRERTVGGIRARMLTAGACREALEALDTAVAEYLISGLGFARTVEEIK